MNRPSFDHFSGCNSLQCYDDFYTLKRADL